MDKGRSCLKKKILRLTLEILYLLTGEDYGPIKKKPSGHVKPWWRPKAPSMRPEGNNQKKILEVAKEIIELLTEEVPIRCQDVAVYFSMEEREYLKGHKELYKAAKREEPPPLKAGSRKRNPPKRWPRPIYSQDSAHEELSTPQEHEYKQTVIGIPVETEEEKPNFQIKDEETSPEIGRDGSWKANHPERWLRPLSSQDSAQEEHGSRHCYQHKETMTEAYVDLEEEKADAQIKKERIIPEISREGTNERAPERCLRPSDCRDSTKEDFSSNGFQEEDLNIVFLEVDQDAKEADTKLKQEEEPVEIYSDGRYWADTGSEERLTISPEGKQEDATADSPSKHLLNSIPLPARPCLDVLCRSSTQSGHLMDQSNLATLSRVEGRFPCPDCGKSFNYRAKLVSHQITHTHEKPFSCEICGKKFAHKTSLVDHHKIHTGEKPFSCPFCGKCFIQKSKMTRHQRIHTGEKPYICSECDRCFAYRSNLIDHQRTHTCDTLFPCADCGKCFTHKNRVLAHQKLHTGEKPYSCSDCEKCFSHKFNLLEHQKTHTGEKPFECSLCGKFFARKSNLVEHHKVHTGEKPFHCSDCGQRFAHRSTLVKHQSTHKVMEVPMEKTLQKIQLGL